MWTRNWSKVTKHLIVNSLIFPFPHYILGLLLESSNGEDANHFQKMKIPQLIKGCSWTFMKTCWYSFMFFIIKWYRQLLLCFCNLRFRKIAFFFFSRWAIQRASANSFLRWTALRLECEKSHTEYIYCYLQAGREEGGHH